MEDNVKGLIRTCCIVLIISIGLSVVYSAKRPYIYLLDNYDYYYPPATPDRAYNLYQHQHQNSRRSSQNYAAGRIGVDSGYGGNDYNNKFYRPLVFYDTHRNGEVTTDAKQTIVVEEPVPLSPPITAQNGTNITGSSKKRKNVRKSVKKGSTLEDEYAGTEVEDGTAEEPFPFPIPWIWNVRMAQMNRARKTDDEDRRFKLPRLPKLPTIEFKVESKFYMLFR